MDILKRDVKTWMYRRAADARSPVCRRRNIAGEILKQNIRNLHLWSSRIGTIVSTILGNSSTYWGTLEKEILEKYVFDNSPDLGQRMESK